MMDDSGQLHILDSDQLRIVLENGSVKIHASPAGGYTILIASKRRDHFAEVAIHVKTDLALTVDYRK